MSREINVNDPDSWDDDDKAYLRERPEMVPAEHREALSVPQAFAPSATVENPSVARLRNYVRLNFPDRAGEDPVDVVIDELGGSEVVTEEEGDDYDSWKISELRAEAEKRQMTEAEVPQGDDARKKSAWVGALRDWDGRNPAA